MPYSVSQLVIAFSRSFPFGFGLREERSVSPRGLHSLTRETEHEASEKTTDPTRWSRPSAKAVMPAIPATGRKSEPGRPWRDSGRSGHQDLPVQRRAHVRRQVRASFANVHEGPALAHVAYMGPQVLGCVGSRGNKEQRALGCA